jgi:hypothetical protein
MTLVVKLPPLSCSAILLAIVSMLAVAPTHAQDVVVDWSKRTVVNSALEIQKGQPLKVQVINVNDVLYEYDVGVQVTTDSSDDFALLGNLLTNLPAPPKGLAPDICVEALKDASTKAKKINTELEAPGKAFNPEDKPGHYISIALAATLQDWNSTVFPAYKALQTDVDTLTKCSDESSTEFVNKTYPPIKNLLGAIQKKVEGKHTAEGQAPASTGDVVSAIITVSEKWKGSETFKDQNQPTASPSAVTVRFSSILRLSAGALFSQLQDRSYVSRTIPSGAGTANVLGANGNSTLTPYLVGLLNYKLPIPEVKQFNFWLASGPTLRVTNSGSNSSAFGYFGGVSVSLWNRLFITPGIHFGQFADVPTGLSIGQTIPTNFGQLQPVNRWTARFGFSITYKTLSLGALTKNANPPKPAQAPKPKS